MISLHFFSTHRSQAYLCCISSFYFFLSIIAYLVGYLADLLLLRRAHEDSLHLETFHIIALADATRTKNSVVVMEKVICYGFVRLPLVCLYTSTVDDPRASVGKSCVCSSTTWWPTYPGSRFCSSRNRSPIASKWAVCDSGQLPKSVVSKRKQSEDEARFVSIMFLVRQPSMFISMAEVSSEQVGT